MSAASSTSATVVVASTTSSDVILPSGAESTTSAASASSSAASSSNAVAAATSTSTDSSSSSASSSSSKSSTSSTTASSTTGILLTRTVALSGDQLVFLDLMRSRYSLGSTIQKTLRCLVNYARTQDVSTQKFIFATYRCRKCGIKFPKTDTQVELYEHQWSFLDQMRDEHKISDPQSNGKALRVLLDFTQEGRTKRGQTDGEKAAILEALEKDIFTIVRCNQPKCTHQH